MQESSKNPPEIQRPNHASTEKIRPEFQSFLNRTSENTGEIRKTTDSPESERYKMIGLFQSIRLNLNRGTLPKCTNGAENSALMSLTNQLEHQGFDLTRGYPALGEMLYKENMSKQDILDLIENNKGKLEFIGAILGTGGTEKLGMDNDSLILFGKKILNEAYDKTSEEQKKGLPFEDWKTHVADDIWGPIAHNLKLEGMSTEEIISFAIKHNESYLYQELIEYNEKVSESLRTAPKEQRIELAQRIARTHAPLRGIDPQDPYAVEKISRVGGPMPSVLSFLIHDLK